MGSFGIIGPRREVKASLTSLQWLRKSNEFGVSGKCSPRPPLGTINVIFAAQRGPDLAPPR